MENFAMRWRIHLFWSFFVFNIICERGTKGQFNIYGVNIELVKMRLIRQPFYVQEYQLQVDYTHRNKVIDYGVVTVGGVQDQTDFIFVESINRNPFHLPKVEIQGDVCFRLFVQNNDVLFDECTQIRDLPGGSPYYNSKYITRTKNDGHCSCTASIVMASFEGTVILIAALAILYYFKFYEKQRKKSSLNKVAISSPRSDIYADNAVTTTSIAWGTYYASNPVNGNANFQSCNTVPMQKPIVQNLTMDKLAISSNKEVKEVEAPRLKIIQNNDLKTKISKSIIDQIMATTTDNKPMSVKQTNENSSMTVNKSATKKSKNSKTKNKQKKIPPDPPPPDYKNDGFEDDEDFDNESRDERKSRDRIYDRLESPK